MGKFIALGEVLEDYVPDFDGQYVKLVGGAPLNLASMVSALGVDTYIITCLGKDEGSERVLQMIKKEGIKTDYIKRDPLRVLCHTEVKVKKRTGERSFKFFKNNASFLGLRPSWIQEDWFQKGDVLHVGTVCLFGQHIIDAQRKALALAQAAGCFITFDPNFRPGLFKEGEQEFYADKFMSFANIVKLSEEEVPLVSSKQDYGEGAKQLLTNFSRLKGVLVTLGNKGMDLFLKDRETPLHVEGIKPRAIMDTIGCGDASFGAFISVLFKAGCLDNDRFLATPDDLFKRALTMGSLAGSLICAQKGALAVPTAQDVFDFAKERNIVGL